MDYFDALLRSAGVGGNAVVAAPAVPQSAAPDLVEMSDEFEAPAEPSAAPVAGEAKRADGTPVAAPAGAGNVPAHAAEVAATRGEQPDPDRAATLEPAPPRRMDPVTAVVHPLVQAALHWVAAGSTDAGERDATDSRMAPARDDAPKPLPLPVTETVPSRRTTFVADPAEEPWAAPQQRQGRKQTPQPIAIAPLRRADGLEPTRLPRPAAARADAPHLPEVYIGRIHVTVDAPRPPAAPPVPSPSPPPAPPPAARSAFLRSRAPRL